MTCQCTSRRRRPCGELDCFNSFAVHDRAAQWSSKNDKTPNEVSLSSGIPRIFDCDKCPHEYSTQLNHIIATNQGCPYCANQKLCTDEDCEMCFKNSFASHKRAKYWSKNNKEKKKGSKKKTYISPREVHSKSGHHFEFDCPHCPHSFKAVLHSITNGSWCPYCAKPAKQLCKSKACKFCFNKSFASHKHAKDWSSKNKKITPRDVFLNTNKKRWFDCDVCPHDFESAPDNVVKGSWCPYCDTKLCKELDCDWCFKKSFASHKRSKCWSMQNKLTPRDISLSSNFSYWFKCDKCPHEFKKQMCSVTGKKESWCQYCNSYKLCNDVDCKFCFNKSFASHFRAQYWSKTNKISPRDITHGIRRKHDFDCPDCGRWFQILIANITCLGQWCGACKHKTEAKLLKWLNTVIKAAIIHGAKFEWCKNKKFLPLDFCIEQFKLIIELDGIQHFKLVKLYRNSPAENLKNDMYKLRCAIKNGYTVIRLLQEDVWNDRNNWQARLLPYLRKHNTQKIILIDNKNEYDPMRREIKRTMKRIPVTNDKLPKVPRKLLKESSSSDSDSSSDDESKTKITNKKQSRSHSSNT